MTAVHRIRRLRWRVNTNARDQAFDLRARMRRLVDTELLPSIEQAFDAADSGETIHVPRLELSLRLADLDAIGPAVAERIGDQARAWLQARSSDVVVTPGVARAVANDAPGRSARAADAPASGVEALRLYFETGALPWPMAGLGREQTRAWLIEQSRLHMDRLLAAVPSTFDRAAVFLFRWLQAVPGEHWIEIARRIDTLWPDRPLRSAAAVADLIEARPPAIAVGARPHAAAIFFAVMAVRRRGQEVSATTVNRALDGIAASIDRAAGDAAAAGIASLADNGPATLGSSATAAAWVLDRLAPAPRPGGHPIEVSPVDRSPASPRTTEAAAGVLAGGRDEDGDRDEATDEAADEAAAAFGLSVEHAGLVLLHPFLPRLFEQTAIVAPGARTIAPEVLPRAAALLSFAARGDDDPIDFELGFIKVLLGLQPDTILLAPPGLLTAADREEVDALLHSAIEHWRVLKHTSIAGLRTSFLQRQGLVAEVDGAWRLRVEPGAFDVLLDHLPWGLSTVTLPWMARLLFTEWAPWTRR